MGMADEEEGRDVRYPLDTCWDIYMLLWKCHPSVVSWCAEFVVFNRIYNHSHPECGDSCRFKDPILHCHQMCNSLGQIAPHQNLKDRELM